MPNVRRRKGGFPVKRSTDLGYIPNSGSNMWLKSVWAEIGIDPLIEANPNLAKHPTLQKLQKQLTESIEKLEKEGAK